MFADALPTVKTCTFQLITPSSLNELKVLTLVRQEIHESSED